MTSKIRWSQILSEANNSCEMHGLKYSKFCLMNRNGAQKVNHGSKFMLFVELSSFLIQIKSSDSDIEKPRFWSELQNMHIRDASEANNNGWDWE